MHVADILCAFELKKVSYVVSLVFLSTTNNLENRRACRKIMKTAPASKHRRILRSCYRPREKYTQ